MKHLRESRWVTEGYVLLSNGRKISYKVRTRSKLQARRRMKEDYPNGKVYITLTKKVK